MITLALIRFGGGITEMRGSIAGNTYARNRFGAYNRARTKPVNPRSARQMGARLAIMFLSEQWREAPMTDAKRTAWETYAASVNWQNKLGEVVKLTGFNHFIRGNAAQLRVGGWYKQDGPLDLGLPGSDPTLTITALSAAGQNCTITLNDTLPWCSEDHAYLIVEMGIPQNPTRTFFNGPWRVAGWVSASVAAPVASPILAFPLGLGWTLVVGQKVFLRCSIARGDGRLTTKFQPEPQIVGA